MTPFQLPSPIALARRALLLAAASLTLACSSVPKETVELSYTMGQDIRELQLSYDRLIVDRFDTWRARREAWLQDEWVPDFLGSFVEDGRLIEAAQGKVVWDEEAQQFVDPTPGAAQQQRLDTVQTWSRIALDTIEQKRQELMAPLNAREAEIRAEVQEAFAQVLAANALITAQLNALREVEEVQQDLTRRLGVDSEIDDINRMLSQTSVWAEEQLETLEDSGL